MLWKEIMNKLVVDLLQQKGLGCWKVLKKRWKQKGKVFPQLTNSTKISATFSKEHPLLSTSSSWVWVAPSTTLTLWSLSRNWVLIFKELRSLPPSSMCTLWNSLLNLSIPDVPFPVLLSTLIRSRFQVKPATLLIPIDFPFLFVVEELYGTRYQSGSFSLIDVGSGFHRLRSFFLLFLFFQSA